MDNQYEKFSESIRMDSGIGSTQNSINPSMNESGVYNSGLQEEDFTINVDDEQSHSLQQDCDVDDAISSCGFIYFL